VTDPDLLVLFDVLQARVAAAQAGQSLFPGKGPDTIFAAIGHLGQWVIISPDQDLVLVRLGKTNDGNLAPVRKALGDVVASVE
jgi:CubicO group peptidase (beta-lactamase class C family)